MSTSSGPPVFPASSLGRCRATSTSSTNPKTLARSLCCADPDDQMEFTTIHLQGDGLRDPVITQACDAAGVGTNRWIPHPGVCE